MEYDKNIKRKYKINKALRIALVKALKEISIGAVIKLSELDEYDLEAFVDSLEEDGFDIIEMEY